MASSVSVRVDTFGTGRLAEEEIERLLMQEFDLSLIGIIEQLELRKPLYHQVAANGHFSCRDL